MRDLGIAVGLAQYKIAAMTYKIFDAQAFLNTNGGLEAVRSDEKQLEVLASHLGEYVLYGKYIHNALSAVDCL